LYCSAIQYVFLIRICTAVRIRGGKYCSIYGVYTTGYTIVNKGADLHIGDGGTIAELDILHYERHPFLHDFHPPSVVVDAGSGVVLW
jgi:hypothetical protein